MRKAILVILMLFVMIALMIYSDVSEPALQAGALQPTEPPQRCDPWGCVPAGQEGEYYGFEQSVDACPNPFGSPGEGCFDGTPDPNWEEHYVNPENRMNVIR